MPSPSYVPLLRQGVDAAFASVTVTGATTTTPVLQTYVTGDTSPRVQVRADGRWNFGSGSAPPDATLYRSAPGALTTDGFLAMNAGQSSGTFSVYGGSLILGTAGVGLKIKEGANAVLGVATLAAGTVTVPTTAVTATSRIQLTAQSLGTVTAPKALAVTTRTAGSSFTITSADATDTSVVAWQITEPA